MFDYLAGKVASPKPFITKLGLEWLFRLITQPWRWRRIIRATIVFLYTTLAWRFRMSFIYRNNAVALILNKEKQALLVTPMWSKMHRWQFPQGGINKKENPEQAVRREMKEELGTDNFNVLAYEKGIHRYDWPWWYRLLNGYRGQKQNLFILRFKGQNKDIIIEANGEIRAWQWVATNDVIRQLAHPRKALGKKALKIFRTLDF